MLPIRPHAGPNRGTLEWRRPTRESVTTILTHPLYAGTYGYGFRQIDPRRKNPEKRGSGRVVMEPQNYHALIPGHCPAYITVERYERNQRRLAENRAHAESKGVPRDGPSLLGGLIFCGRCGHRMSIHYSGRQRTLRYVCVNAKINCEGPQCQCLAGKPVDDLVAAQVLKALEPASLELSLSAAGELQKERERLDRNWKQRVERARYDAERAERQYRVVEPENRLVARELERRWEAELKALKEVEQEYARFRQTHPVTLSTEEREAIRSLSKNLPALWHASTTTSADRQRIVRLLLERAVVTLRGSSEHVDVSPATIDRLLNPIRSGASQGTKRRRATKPSKQIPIRTFADWNEPEPGFLEIDFVSHGGSSMRGVFLWSLVATDVCSGWVEMLPLVAREQSLVVEGLEVLRRQFPMPIRGIDSDNDSAFINETLLTYCQQQKIEFTRSRAYQKNDQAWIEQKNGAVIRRFIGYERYTGPVAAQCLARLFQMVRLFVNYFQPSFKLLSKTREGAKVKKRYHKPATPCDRLLAHASISSDAKETLRATAASLDPLNLLHRISEGQSVLAALRSGDLGHGPDRESLEDFPGQTSGNVAVMEKCVRRIGARPPSTRDWRTRKDPFRECVAGNHALASGRSRIHGQVSDGQVASSAPGLLS